MWMTDFFLELGRAFIVGLVIVFFLVRRDLVEITRVRGWQWIYLGFLLFFFGTLIDITDNFASLNRFVVIGDTKVEAFLEKVVGYLLGFLFLALGVRQWLPQVVEKERALKRKYNAAESRIRMLTGLLPICSSCKKIRDAAGCWKPVETYICRHADVEFSHSICPDCAGRLYPHLDLDTDAGPNAV